MVLLQILGYLFSILSICLNATLFIRLKPPASIYFVIFQLVAAALSPIILLMGIVGGLLGIFSHTILISITGFTGALISFMYITLVTFTRPSENMSIGFGKDVATKTAGGRSIFLRIKNSVKHTPEPIFEKDIPFWTIEGTSRNLLCDIWQPANGVERSGMAIVFFHGSAWYFLDKDTGTRPFFRQLASQGHVIMDVAYRLTPEVDIFGMVGDVKRAIVWMKENASQYQIHPDRIVLGGGSAGGHLSLLAAYTPETGELTPEEIAKKDLSVCGVFSLYGPSDLAACYTHLDQKRLVHLPKVEIGQPGAATMKKGMKDAGRLDMLLGGHLHEKPEMYRLASPVSHVSENSPPTILIQGEADIIAPVTATRELYEKLCEHGVPAANIVYPFTNHAFDLLWPSINPAAIAATSSIQWFLKNLNANFSSHQDYE